MRLPRRDSVIADMTRYVLPLVIVSSIICQFCDEYTTHAKLKLHRLQPWRTKYLYRCIVFKKIVLLFVLFIVKLPLANLEWHGW